MLFSIGDSVIKSINNKQNMENINKILASIHRALSGGVHLVSFESNILEEFSSDILHNESLCEEAKKLLATCLSHWSYFRLTKKYVAEYILIENDSCDYKWKNVKGKNIFTISVDSLISSKILIENPVTLVSEDYSDCDFYVDFAKNKIKEDQNLKKFDINFKSVGGGGDNIRKAMLASVTKNKEISLAICDSDKRYPEQSYGQTASNLEKAVETLRKQNYLGCYSHYILQVYEKENLISPSVYETTRNASIDVNALKIFKEIEQEPDLVQYLKYMDFKCGIKKYNWNKSIEIRNFYSKLLLDKPDYFCHLKNITGRGDKDNITVCLGKNCLSDLKLNELDCPTPNYLANEYDLILQKIVSWGICSEPIYA